MKNLISNPYANYYLNAADSLNIKFKVLNEAAALAEIYSNKTKIKLTSNILDLNTQISGEIATNKKKTLILLGSGKIPVPDFKTFTDPTDAKEYLVGKIKESEQMVVKPIGGSLSIGVYINPTNQDQAEKAIDSAFSGSNEIMIENFIAGNNYRISVLDNEIIAVTKRLPAFVVGDQKLTVSELIVEKNIQRKKHQLPEIVLRNVDREFLTEKNINETTVYPLGKKIILQTGCDFDIGGERVQIAREAIPDVSKEMFIRSLKLLGLRFAGIDYISPDITKPYTKIKGGINEINSAPYSEVHFWDSYPTSNYAAERILRKLFNLDHENRQ